MLVCSRKEDIRLEAVKGLHSATGDEKLSSRVAAPSSPILLPDFTQMVSYIKQKVW